MGVLKNSFLQNSQNKIALGWQSKRRSQFYWTLSIPKFVLF